MTTVIMKVVTKKINSIHKDNLWTGYYQMIKFNMNIRNMKMRTFNNNMKNQRVKGHLQLLDIKNNNEV
jgi:hypothetical protein